MRAPGGAWTANAARCVLAPDRKKGSPGDGTTPLVCANLPSAPAASGSDARRHAAGVRRIDRG